MRGLEGLAFLCLINCLLFVTLSLTVLTGRWAIAGNIIAVVLAILSGGLYAASTGRRGRSND